MIYWPAKAPNEVEDFTFDFRDVLDASETISSKTVTVIGATKNSDTIVTVGSEAASGVQVWLQGGTLGTPATVVCTIVTSLSRTYSETAVLLIGEEPVSVHEAKAQVRMVDDDSEDTFIASLISPARSYVERISRYYWVAARRTEAFNAWGDFLEIYRRPVASVDTITYVDESGEDAEYTGFLASLGRFPLRIYPGVDTSFPGLGTGGAITVAYTSGVLASTSEEYLIGKRAMLLVIGYWFENREAGALGSVAGATEFAVKSLLDTLAPVSAY